MQNPQHPKAPPHAHPNAPQPAPPAAAAREPPHQTAADRRRVDRRRRRAGAGRRQPADLGRLGARSRRRADQGADRPRAQVNGTTALLFTPGPHIVITDATFSDPEERAGTADFSVGRLVLDLNLFELLSRQVDAERVVLERPGADGPPRRRRSAEARSRSRKARPRPRGEKPRRDVKLRDVRIEDGTVNIVYDDKGTKRSASSILPRRSACRRSPTPFTGTGKFDWKGETVDFNFTLTSLADLREKRPRSWCLPLDTPGHRREVRRQRADPAGLHRRGRAVGQGAFDSRHCSPGCGRSRPRPPRIGDGELASHVAWKKGEITFSNARFALEHAQRAGPGGGHAEIAAAACQSGAGARLSRPQPVSAGQPGESGRCRGKPNDAEPDEAAPRAESAAPRRAPANEAPPPEDGQIRIGSTSLTKIRAPAPASRSRKRPRTRPRPSPLNRTQPPQDAAPVAAVPAPAASPASFDADVNLNVRKTRVAHLEIGPSSLGLAFRDGVLNATLGGMDLYDGHASGKLMLDASKPVPAFTGDFLLDGVQAKTAALRCRAVQPARRPHQARRFRSAAPATNAEEIKSSLHGQGSLAVSDGAIDGVDLTEMIGQIGAGEIPELRQGPGAKTAFTDLGGSFTIKNGIAETSNLQVTSPLLKVAGGRHRRPDAKHDQHAGQSGDRWRTRRAGRRQRSRRAFACRSASRARSIVPPSGPRSRACSPIPSKAGKTVQPDRRGVAEEVQGQAGRRGARPLPRQCPDRPRAARARTARPSPNRTASAQGNRLRAPTPKTSDGEQGDNAESGDPDLEASCAEDPRLARRLSTCVSRRGSAWLSAIDAHRRQPGSRL